MDETNSMELQLLSIKKKKLQKFYNTYLLTAKVNQKNLPDQFIVSSIAQNQSARTIILFTQTTFLAKLWEFAVMMILFGLSWKHLILILLRTFQLGQLIIYLSYLSWQKANQYTFHFTNHPRHSHRLVKFVLGYCSIC